MINFCTGAFFCLDPLSWFFLGVIALVSFPSALFSVGYLRGGSSKVKLCLSFALLAAFVLSMCMVVLSANLFVFLVSWELMSLVSYFLVVSDHIHEKSVRAGTIYFVMTHIGTAFIIAGFLVLYSYAGSFDFAAVKAACQSMPLSARNIVFLLLLVGFATKAGVVPLHIWLPYAHPQAPSYVSSIMSGAMIKTAIYGMLRFFIVIMGPCPRWWGGTIIILAIVSCLVGVVYALMDIDLKKLLAYSSVENIGIILLGVGLAMFFQNSNMPLVMLLAMSAGLYHLINHALFKGLLFLCSGSVLKATGTRDMEKMGGLIKKMPQTALFFLIGAMGISALPPLNGFVSEWLMLQSFFAGALNSQGLVKIFIVLAASGLALTSGLAAACFVKAFGISFLGLARSKRAEEAKEVSFSMNLGAGILAVLVVLFGVGAGLIMPYIFHLAEYILGVQYPGFVFRWFIFSLPIGQIVSFSPAILAGLLIILCLGISAWFIFGLRRKTVKYNTWDCGYYNLDARNEYTSIAFSKPFRLAFSFFLLPYRKSEKIRDSFYHVRAFNYETRTTLVFKHFFYQPLLRFVYRTAFKLRKIQPGSLNLYVLYIFVALAALIYFAGGFFR